VVYLHPGYVSAVRVPEEVSSVVLGDPKDFADEHSEAEPRLVFIKPVLTKPGETNVLITTKSGHEIPLHLISNGDSQVDFLLDFQVARASFMIPSTLPSFAVAETKAIGSPEVAPVSAPSEASATAETALLKATRASTPRWEGKQLKVAVGQVSESGHRTVVSFSALNTEQFRLNHRIVATAGATRRTRQTKRPQSQGRPGSNRRLRIDAAQAGPRPTSRWGLAV
jgi:hypothetical protein